MREWLKQPGECFDKNGIPIYPGDLLRTFHFTGPRRKKFFLYHVAVFDRDASAMRMVPVNHLEPTKRDHPDSRGGNPLLSDDLASVAEIIQGYGPLPYLDYLDRPKRKKQVEASRCENG